MSWTERVLTAEQAQKLLPDRRPDAHKGNFGRILLLCGSRGYTGSAYLAAMGALRSGGGLVFLGVPESIYAIEAVKLNEAIVFPLPDRDGAFSSEASGEVRQRTAQMDAVVIGPGLGQSDGALAVLRTVLAEARCPVVVDADGINLLGKHIDLLRGRQNPTILTPHEMEFARLGGDRQLERTEGTLALARSLRCIVVRKGRGSLITDGSCCYRNPTGNPGMAVGGSGDVLAGMIGAFLGQGMPPLEAAACGCWFHGAAGDLCAEELGQYGMLPTDMLRVLPRLLK